MLNVTTVAKRVTLLVSAASRLAAGKLGIFLKFLDAQEADLAKEEVATEATAAIAMTEEMTDADQGAHKEIAVRALQGTIAERVVVTDVMTDLLTEKVGIVIAVTTTDVIPQIADAVLVAAPVETTRVTLLLAQKVEIPKKTATRKAARLQVSVKTDRVRN